MNKSTPRPNYYAGAALDRASELRKDEAWLAARREHPSSRFLPVWRSKNLVQGGNGGASHAVTLPPGEASALTGGELPVVFLGLVDGNAHFAVDLSHEDAPEELPALAGKGSFADLRLVGPLLDRDEGAMLAYARGIMTWHRRHGFCGQCGQPTRSIEGGHVRLCSDEACGLQQFPRTDPAVIMLVSHGDRCLLGRQAAWPKGMHSTLAGFVEPGEALEDAVAREVFEEAGLRVTDVRYHSSQPWPFPTSLMLGFYASAVGDDIRVDKHELEDARWFARDWILAHEDDEDFRLPRQDSIARRLVEGWLGRG